MPETPVQVLSTPPLRPIWKIAKEKAETEAKKLGQTDAYKTFLKNKMKIDLGPDLEDWHKCYPDFTKLNTEKLKIENTVKLYRGSVKAAELDAKVKKFLNDALNEIETELE